jgi:RNA binding exosome subunit
MRVWVFAALVAPAVGYVDRGILKLDNTTFDRIVDGSRPVFVRFDKEYAYGDEVRTRHDRRLEQDALLQQHAFRRATTAHI